MWFAVSGILLLFLYMNPMPAKAALDGRLEDAIRSLTREIRASSRTVNSHHEREHYLNENLKRSVEDLSRKVSMIDRFEARFSHIEIQLSKFDQLIPQVQNITSKLESIESYLERAQKAANKAEKEPKKPMVEIGAIREEQTKALGKVAELLEDTLSRIQVLPTTIEVQLLHNETQAALKETKDSLQSTVDEGINRMINSVGEHNNETKDNIENLRTDLATNAGNLNQKLHKLESGQRVILSTAEDVITLKEDATTLKKRLQYGIDEITGNVAGLMISHDTGNKNLNDKIDKISNDIIDNQSKELKNLTSKADEGLKQIWRQIGVLYQKMDTNGEALDNLYKQNEICVNGTIPAIVGLRVEINAIETRMNLRTESSIGSSESRLTTQLKNITDTVIEISERAEPTEPTPTTESVSASDIISKLDATEARCIENVGRIESRLISTAIENEGEAATRAEKLQTVFTEVQNITSKLESIESYLERAQNAADEAGEKFERPMVDIGAIREEQTKALGKVTELLEDTLSRIQVLPTVCLFETQVALKETKDSLQSTVDEGINRMINSAGEHNNETTDTIERLRTDLATNAGNVNQTLRELESGQRVMLPTAEDVITLKEDVTTLKKRLQYGIQEITGNVASLMISHETGNKNLNDKIDKISNDIIDNQRKELKNLTSKTDEGLMQIWRQISVVYQKMETNGEALDNLNKQNEICVNGTIPAIVGLREEVARMQSDVNKAESHLNYLLQQRGLMTKEFNTMKSNLGTASSDVKSLLREIKENIEDLKRSGRQTKPFRFQWV